MNKFTRRAVTRSRINSEYYLIKKGQKTSYPGVQEEDKLDNTEETKS